MTKGLLVAATALAVVFVWQSVATAADGSSSTAATKCADPSGKVNLGVSYFSNAASVAQNAIGADTSNVPADQAIVDGLKAGVTQLNAAGGLAGCDVNLVTYRYPASTPDWGQQSQQECTAFTQDVKVFAVFSAGSYENHVGVECFTKAKLPFFVSGGKYQPTCDDLKKGAPYLYYVNGVASCRFNQLVTLWNKAGLFPKDAKVGIMAADDGTGQGDYVANKAYGPALKKLKIPYEVASYHQTASASDLSNTTVTMNAAILKFKNDGVNVVIFTPGGATTVAFLTSANSQGFYPAYGLNTSDALALKAQLGAEAMKTKAIAVSWQITDLPLQAQQALPANPAITECATWTAPSTTTLTGVSGYCDFLNLLQASLGKAKDVKPATLRKGIDAQGTKFKATTTYNGDLKFGAKVNGGNIDEVQMLQYDPATKTFVKIPGTKPVPLDGT
ncbi:MAG: ABC transporter substrate-binding protein [Acidimicrobiia bacterium]